MLVGRGRIKGVETTTLTNDLVSRDTAVNLGFQLIRVSHITEEVKAHLIITDGMVVTERKVGTMTVMIERVADIAVVTIETVVIDAVGRGAEAGATAVAEAEAQALNIIGDAAVVAVLEIDLDAIVIQGVAHHTVIQVVSTTQVGLTE